jgi:hypothetical protein
MRLDPLTVQQIAAELRSSAAEIRVRADHAVQASKNLRAVVSRMRGQMGAPANPSVSDSGVPIVEVGTWFATYKAVVSPDRQVQRSAAFH